MARLAFLTIGVLHGPYADPRVAGFVERIDANFAAAAASPGFLALSKPGEGSAWGVETQPAFFAGAEFAGRLPQTLTVWQDLPAVFAFAYTGTHAEALSQRQAWFVKPAWPNYVAWWVADEHTPTWAEAYARYEQLQRQGPTPAAFNFKQAFDAQGQPYTLKRDALKGRGAQTPGGGSTREDDHGHQHAG